MLYGRTKGKCDHADFQGGDCGPVSCDRVIRRETNECAHM